VATLGHTRRRFHGEGRLALDAKARADTPDLLDGPLPKGDALVHGGRHGMGEFGGIITQRISSCGHGGVEARFQVPELPQCVDDTPADVLDYVGDVGIAERLALEKARLEALVGAIKIDHLEEDKMKMEI